MLRISRRVGMAVLVLGLAGGAEDQKGGSRLKLVEAVPRDEFKTVVSVAVSPDGKFVYSSSFQLAIITVCARDPKTGKLEPRQLEAIR